MNGCEGDPFYLDISVPPSEFWCRFPPLFESLGSSLPLEKKKKENDDDDYDNKDKGEGCSYIGFIDMHSYIIFLPPNLTVFKLHRHTYHILHCLYKTSQFIK